MSNTVKNIGEIGGSPVLYCRAKEDFVLPAITDESQRKTLLDELQAGSDIATLNGETRITQNVRQYGEKSMNFGQASHFNFRMGDDYYQSEPSQKKSNENELFNKLDEKVLNHNDLINIFDRICNGIQTKEDINKLRQFLIIDGNKVQFVSQDGKFNTNIGQIKGGHFHFGDIHNGADLEAFKNLLIRTFTRNFQ